MATNHQQLFVFLRSRSANHRSSGICITECVAWATHTVPGLTHGTLWIHLASHWKKNNMKKDDLGQNTCIALTRFPMLPFFIAPQVAVPTFSSCFPTSKRSRSWSTNQTWCLHLSPELGTQQLLIPGSLVSDLWLANPRAPPTAGTFLGGSRWRSRWNTRAA